MAVLKNSRHEKFAVACFNGKTQREAALEAGYKPSRVDVTASELVRNSKIAGRIEELHRAAASPAIMDVKSRKERLTYIAKENNEGKFGFQRQPNISAIAEINKMEGQYPPSKVELEPGEKMSAALAELLGRLRGNKA